MGKKKILQNLTRNLVDYIFNMDTNRINIQKIKKDLNISIRRLYDVLNILEGLNFIYKTTNYIIIKNEFYKLYPEKIVILDTFKEERNISPIPIKDFNLNIFNYN